MNAHKGVEVAPLMTQYLLSACHHRMKLRERHQLTLSQTLLVLNINAPHEPVGSFFGLSGLPGHVSELCRAMWVK
jgi:hypothetical protein